MSREMNDLGEEKFTSTFADFAVPVGIFFECRNSRALWLEYRQRDKKSASTKIMCTRSWKFFGADPIFEGMKTMALDPLCGAQPPRVRSRPDVRTPLLQCIHDLRFNLFEIPVVAHKIHIVAFDHQKFTEAVLSDPLFIMIVQLLQVLTAP